MSTRIVVGIAQTVRGEHVVEVILEDFCTVLSPSEARFLADLLNRTADQIDPEEASR